MDFLVGSGLALKIHAIAWIFSVVTTRKKGNESLRCPFPKQAPGFLFSLGLAGADELEFGSVSRSFFSELDLEQYR